MKNIFSMFKDKHAVIEFLKSMAVVFFLNAVDFLLTALFLYAYGHEHYDGFLQLFTGGGYEPPTSIYITANVIGFVCAILVNYLLSSIFVFKYGNVGKTKKGFVKFLLFSLLGLGLTSLGCYIGYDVLGCNPWLTKIVIQCIVFVYNFITRRLFIFNVDLIRDDENTINL